MKNQNAKAAKVKVSANSLLDAPAFAKVSAWVLLYEGQNAGKVVWTWSAGGTVKCAIVCHVPEVFGLSKDYDSEATMWVLSTKVIGSAGGGGYDKRSAAFDDCLSRNGYTGPKSAGNGAQDFLTGLGFTVITAI